MGMFGGLTEDKGLRINAVWLGLLTDIVGSFVCKIGLGFVLMIMLNARGFPEDEILSRLDGDAFLIPVLVLILGCTALGGYVAGRVAKHSEILHGGMVGGFAAVGEISVNILQASDPLWFMVVLIVSAVPFGIAGGSIARQRHDKK